VSISVELPVEHHETLTIDESYEGVTRITMPRLARSPDGWKLELWHDEALQLAIALTRVVAVSRRDQREAGPA
jgi:hypothetical protein